MTENAYDARDVVIVVDGIIIPELQSFNFDPGETTEAATSNQGFVGHQIKHGAGKLTFKFKAKPHSATLAHLGGLFDGKNEFTATITSPDIKGTLIRAMLAGYPKRQEEIGDMPDYEVEINGQAKDVRYE